VPGPTSEPRSVHCIIELKNNSVSCSRVKAYVSFRMVGNDATVQIMNAISFKLQHGGDVTKELQTARDIYKVGLDVQSTDIANH